MTEYAWSELRARAIQLYEDAPQGPTEARILAVFERKPALVDAAIDHVADRFQRGIVRSPWPVLARHVEEAADVETRASSTVATDSSERDEKVARAEKWIRSTGLHFDREAEIEDELFGDRGILRHWASDDELVERLLSLWRDQRPRGETVEREAEERARIYVEGRHKLAEVERRRAEDARVPPAVAKALEL